jgi:hypothetical protein
MALRGQATGGGTHFCVAIILISDYLSESASCMKRVKLSSSSHMYYLAPCGCVQVAVTRVRQCQILLGILKGTM